MKITQEEITAVIDTREQLPYVLDPMPVTTGTLHVGDYSVAGLERVIAVERKALSDFIACCGRERERFQRELNVQGYACSKRYFGALSFAIWLLLRRRFHGHSLSVRS